MVDNFEELVRRGRERMPDVAIRELEAGSRLDFAIHSGDIPGGVQALTEWIDARCLMAAYVQCDDEMTARGVGHPPLDPG